MFTFYTVDTIRYFAKEYHRVGSVPVAEGLADNHLSWCFLKCSENAWTIFDGVMMWAIKDYYSEQKFSEVEMKHVEYFTKYLLGYFV